MAVDTAQKRASIVSIGLMAIAPGIIPDGTIGQGDRQAIGYSYAGVLDEAPTAGFICIESAHISVPKCSATIAVPVALGTMRC